MKDYYAILEVSATASQAIIREQYLLLIQAWHPDKFRNPVQKERAEEKCKEINAAYEILKDSRKRAEYDHQRIGQSSSYRQEQREGQAAEQKRRQEEEQRRRAEDQRRRQEEEQRRRKQAEEKQRQADYERQQREQVAEKRHRIDLEEKRREDEEKGRAIIRQMIESAQARRKLSGEVQVKADRTIQHPIRVLIVDDIRETRAHLRARISDALDIKVCGEASNGKDAIKQFSAFMPDVMTTCINMPDMDGIAATAEICRQHPGAEVIIISVQGSSNYIRAAMLAGACDYLVKPPTAEALITAIRRAAG